MKLAIAAIFLVTLSTSYAHEGHGTPGALPAAPHGGIVQEAEHHGTGEHHGKEERELFFEVVYKNKELSIYPLTLGTGNSFTALSAKNDLTNVKLKIEHPRSKKVETPKFEVLENMIRTNFDAKSTNRFIVYLIADFEKESKNVKIQIEKN
jgi:hypothetical protein